MPLAGVVYPVCLPNAARPLLPGIPQQSLRRWINRLRIAPDVGFFVPLKPIR